MLIPNNVQSTKMHQYAGAARFAYNWALAREKENYEKTGKFIKDTELRKEFTRMRHSDEYTWLLNVSNNVTKQAIKDACNAYKNFFKGLTSFPRFKSKKRSIPKFYQDNIKIQFSDTHVKFEGFSSSRKHNKQKLNWVRLAEHGRIPTDVKYVNPRISFDGLHWWISVGIEYPDCKERLSDEGVGIDLGIKDLAVCSDTNTYKNINKTRTVKKLEKRKRMLQRSVSRKYEKNRKGASYCKTNNIVKLEKKLLKLNRRLTNIRENYLHQSVIRQIKCGLIQQIKNDFLWCADVLYSELFATISARCFMLKNHHADYMMVQKSAKLAVIDCLHDGIGGYDI